MSKVSILLEYRHKPCLHTTKIYNNELILEMSRAIDAERVRVSATCSNELFALRKYSIRALTTFRCCKVFSCSSTFKAFIILCNVLFLLSCRTFVSHRINSQRFFISIQFRFFPTFEENGHRYYIFPLPIIVTRREIRL